MPLAKISIERSLQTVDHPSHLLIHLCCLEIYCSLKSQHQYENSSESHCVVIINLLSLS